MIDDSYCVVETNFHSKFGEIDIVATNKNFICFIEVKFRGSSFFAYPREFVTHRKQKKIIKTATLYLQKKQSNLQPRFDVIEILGSKHDCRIKIRHIKNAFC